MANCSLPDFSAKGGFIMLVLPDPTPAKNKNEMVTKDQDHGSMRVEDSRRYLYIWTVSLNILNVG